jgi:type I restriction enzyme M protein
LTDEEVARIAATYHAWRGEKGAGKYEDVPGFCKSATTKDIADSGHILTPGRYVGAEQIEDDDELFESKMTRLAATLEKDFQASAELEAAIRSNLRELGYGS